MLREKLACPTKGSQGTEQKETVLSGALLMSSDGAGRQSGRRPVESPGRAVCCRHRQEPAGPAAEILPKICLFLQPHVQ